jgi:hypothetical protein
VSRLAVLGAAILFTSSIGLADTPCFDFSANPDSYFAPAGSTFTVSTTYTNSCIDTTIFIGDSFGSDESAYISSINLLDPSFFLAPGDSVTTGFADYTWDASAPDGFVWNPNINAYYYALAGVCSDFNCSIVDQGYAFTDFTATVGQPVPEPTTLLLLSTGAAGLLLKARKRRRSRGRPGS